MATIMETWMEDCPKGRSQWRLGTEENNPVRFPTARRLKSLFKKQVPTGGEFEVITRIDNCMIVQFDAGTKASDRERFLCAIDLEMRASWLG